MIISETNIFNIFPGLIQLSNILKIIMNNSHREIITYIPSSELRINKIYFVISNKSEKV